MAFGKTASCIILASAAMASAAQFTVRHEHWQDHCNGILTMDDKGVRFDGPKKHMWSWKYQDIQQLTLSPDQVTVLTYKDHKPWAGSDRGYRFTGNVPAAELYALLKDRLDQRFVAALGRDATLPAWMFPVKHLGTLKSSEGTLIFDSDAVSYSTAAKEGSRTWRYMDIDNISSSGPFQLTLTTYEREKYAFNDRKSFNFQLKEPLNEATYNEIWLQIQKKNGRIQPSPADGSGH